MKTVLITNRKLNPIQRFYLKLQLGWQRPLVLPHPLRDTHWSGTLTALGSFISMTVDIKRHRLIQVLGSGIYFRNLHTGEILQKTEPLWGGRTAYHQDDLLVFSAEHTTVVHPETLEILRTHPWSARVSRDGSTALTYPDQVAYDALSGDLLQDSPAAKRNIGISDLSEDGTYSLQVSSPEDSKGFIYQIVEVASREVKATLPGLFMTNDPQQNAPTFLSHDPKSHHLAVGHWNNTVRVLNTLTWETQHTLDLYGRAEGYVGLHLSGGVLHYVTPSQVGTYTLSDGLHQHVECPTHGFEQALFHDGLWILATHGITTVLQGNGILWQSQDRLDGGDEACSLHLKVTDATTFTGELVWRGETFQLSGQVKALRFSLRGDVRSEIRWESTLLDPQGQVAGRLSALTRHDKQYRLGEGLDCDIWRGVLHTSGFLSQAAHAQT